MNSVYPNIDRELTKRHMSYSKLAKEVGLSKHAMYRRITGRTDFKLAEAVRICLVFDTIDAAQLFLRLNTKI